MTRIRDDMQMTDISVVKYTYFWNIFKSDSFHLHLQMNLQKSKKVYFCVLYSYLLLSIEHDNYQYNHAVGKWLTFYKIISLNTG